MPRSDPPTVLTHIDAIHAALGPMDGLRIVDIGCGTSGIGRDLAMLGAECTGIDPFMPASDWQEEGMGRWRVVRASAEAMPIPGCSIDVVMFIYSLHHVPSRVLDPALREARRVLKPGGRLYVAEPLPEGDFNDVIATFHDEAKVRAGAQQALETAKMSFGRRETTHYVSRHTYAGFEPFAAKMQANTRFNDYAAEDVVAPKVRERFETIAARTGGVFDQPVKVDVFQAA